MKINNLRIFINGNEIIKNISCTLPKGTITCCIGKSGAGKTTFLKSIARLIKPFAGTIEIDNNVIKLYASNLYAQKIGFVFQDFNLFPHMTVLQNCIDPLLIQGVSTEQAINRATDILTELGLAEKKDAHPSELSGGQKQRTAIARALCLQPAILVLDEPTSSLDPENSEILKNILQKYACEGLTVLLSTQDMNFARIVSDRILFMQQGEIVEVCEQAAECTGCGLIKTYIRT